MKRLASHGPIEPGQLVVVDKADRSEQAGLVSCGTVECEPGHGYQAAPFHGVEFAERDFFVPVRVEVLPFGGVPSGQKRCERLMLGDFCNLDSHG
jgi:hypothetical protein